MAKQGKAWEPSGSYVKKCVDNQDYIFHLFMQYRHRLPTPGPDIPIWTPNSSDIFRQGDFVHHENMPEGKVCRVRVSVEHYIDTDWVNDDDGLYFSDDSESFGFIPTYEQLEEAIKGVGPHLSPQAYNGDAEHLLDEYLKVTKR